MNAYQFFSENLKTKLIHNSILIYNRHNFLPLLTHITIHFSIQQLDISDFKIVLLLPLCSQLNIAGLDWSILFAIYLGGIGMGCDCQSQL